MIRSLIILVLHPSYLIFTIRAFFTNIDKTTELLRKADREKWEREKLLTELKYIVDKR